MRETLMFHKVVWQHTQGVVGFFKNHFTADLPSNPPMTKIGKLVKI